MKSSITTTTTTTTTPNLFQEPCFVTIGAQCTRASQRMTEQRTHVDHEQMDTTEINKKDVQCNLQIAFQKFLTGGTIEINKNPTPHSASTTTTGLNLSKKRRRNDSEETFSHLQPSLKNQKYDSLSQKILAGGTTKINKKPIFVLNNDLHHLLPHPSHADHEQQMDTN